MYPVARNPQPWLQPRNRCELSPEEEEEENDDEEEEEETEAHIGALRPRHDLRPLKGTSFLPHLSNEGEEEEGEEDLGGLGSFQKCYPKTSFLHHKSVIDANNAQALLSDILNFKVFFIIYYTTL